MIATYIVNLRNMFPAFFVPSKGCRINIQDQLSLYLSYQILTGCTAASLGLWAKTHSQEEVTPESWPTWHSPGSATDLQ